MRQRLPTARLQDHWVTVNGLSLYVQIARRAGMSGIPPVVMIHGLGMSSRYMVPTAVQLAAHTSVSALDLPGFGKSAAPDHVLTIPEHADAVVVAIDALHLERPALLGNSLGCQVVIDVAARYPQQLSAAVLLAPTPDPYLRTSLQVVWRLLRVAFREPASLFAIAFRDYWRAGPFRVTQTFASALHDPVTAKLPFVQVPTLVVHGARDLTLSRRWVEEMTHLLSRGRLVIIPDGAHALNYDAPLQVTNVVVPFLQEVAVMPSRPYARFTDGAVDAGCS